MYTKIYEFQINNGTIYYYVLYFEENSIRMTSLTENANH